MRRTPFSPKRVGKTDTRKSTSRLAPSFNLIRPSCGSRRSAMSSLDMILMREISAFFTFTGKFLTVHHGPFVHFAEIGQLILCTAFRDREVLGLQDGGSGLSVCTSDNRPVVLLDRLEERGLSSDHGLNRVVRAKLEVVQGQHVRG